MKKIVVIMIMLFMTNIKVYAECTTEDKEYFKSIEDKYKVSYDFDKETKTYILNLTYADLSSFSYEIVGDGIENSHTDIVENKLVIKNLIPGQYNVYIVGVSDSCNDIIKEINLTLTNYNKYADDPACEGIEEFVLCSPTYDKELDYDTFISRVNSYKANKNSNDNNNNNDNKDSNKIIDWIKENYMYIVYVLLGIGILTAIIILAKKIYNHAKQRRRLE